MSYWPCLEPHAQLTQCVPFLPVCMGHSRNRRAGGSYGAVQTRVGDWLSRCTATLARGLTQIPWGSGEWAGVQGWAAGSALAAPGKAHNQALPGLRACSLISDGWCPHTWGSFRGCSFIGGALVLGEKEAAAFPGEVVLRETRFAVWCPGAAAGSGSNEGTPSARPLAAACGASEGPSAVQTRASAGDGGTGRERWADRAGLLYRGAAVSPREGVGVVGAPAASLGVWVW